MQEDYGAKRFLIVLMLITLLLGGLVLVFKSDYRIRENMLSNLDYYPHVTTEKGLN
ncbi:MAG: hypothetical protein Kow0029_24000 [Candidatus Rifleibacteriota bacterium]